MKAIESAIYLRIIDKRLKNNGAVSDGENNRPRKDNAAKYSCSNVILLFR